MAIIGIDLGTSNSAAAILRGGRPVIIPRGSGPRGKVVDAEYRDNRQA